MFSILTPYKTLIEALAFAALLAGAAFGGHRFLEHERDIGRNEVQARWTAQIAEDTRGAAIKKQDDDKRAMEAQNAATLRDQQIQTLAASLAAATGSLRDTITAKRAGLSTASPDALRAAADAALVVFGECKERYGALAVIADRHASDVKTLSDAWPRN